ncbi:hypothetical protein CAPTEDRAFT_40037, partial [Capitella teleta]
LHFACLRGSICRAKRLLEKGAHINERDIHGATPLMFAIFNNLEDMEVLKRIVVFLIDQGADVNAEDVNGESPLSLAALKGNIWCAKKLLANKADPYQKNKHGDTALHQVVNQQKYPDEIVEVLLRGGSDAN